MAEIGEDSAALLLVLEDAGIAYLAQELRGAILAAPYPEESEDDPLSMPLGQIRAILSAIDHQLFLPSILLGECERLLKEIAGQDCTLDASMFAESLDGGETIFEQALQAHRARSTFMNALGLPTDRSDLF